ncbi:MAG TPA: hypothetical protein VFM65_05720 [Flavobacteriaceae bacterium]|nr:hypothetical protein [Flavobacteriaceae bacterium]
MKTLKTITTAVVLLITLSSFAQTKEETLEWLKQNGSNYLNFEYVHEGYPCSFTYQFNEEYIEEISSCYETNKRIYYKDIFVIEDIAILDTAIPSHNKFNPRPTFVKIPIKKYEYKDRDDGEYRFSEENGLRHLLWYDADQPNARKNIDKVLRAIMHMAKLSGAEPYKDLFGE